MTRLFPISQRYAWLLPRRLPRRELLLDIALGVASTVYFLGTSHLLGLQELPGLMRDAILGVAVGFRRMWTVPAVIVALLVVGFNILTTWPYPLGFSLILYTAAAGGTRRWFAWAAAWAGLVLIARPWQLLVSELDPLDYLTVVVPDAVLFTFVPAMIGFYARTRRKLLDTLRERADDAASRGRAEERNRLANEIHDVVAHRVSLMVVHAGALRLAAPDERTKEVAEQVRSSGHQALEELRDLVGVLRSDEVAPLAPTARLDGLSVLVEEARRAGNPVELAGTGTPVKLSATAERTAYRAVQEALTNARKHAPGVPVTVHLSWEREGVEIVVRNPVPSQKSRKVEFPASGHGLRSLRERVRLVSGTCSCGPVDQGEWEVRAWLPSEARGKGSRNGRARDDGSDPGAAGRR